MEKWEGHLERRREAFDDGMSERAVELKGLRNYTWDEWQEKSRKEQTKNKVTNGTSNGKKDVGGGGLTSDEEFEAKTDSLVASAPLKHTSLPFYFYSYSRVRDGYRFTFRRKDAKTKFDSTYSCLLNDEITSPDGKLKTGWKVTAFEQKEERRTIPGSKDPNSKRSVDVSTVELKREKDGKTLTVMIGVPDITVETGTELP